MSEDERSKKIEKLEAEIARSLSVIKMKETHKQIEDIEKLRKQASVRSISERISTCREVNSTVVDALGEEGEKLNFDLDAEIKENGPISKLLNTIIRIYESIYFDFQKTVDIKKEDFNRLFPKIELASTNYSSIVANLVCLNVALADMKDYCLRLL